MLLLEYKLNFGSDLAKQWRERPLDHSTSLQFSWKLAVLHYDRLISSRVVFLIVSFRHTDFIASVSIGKGEKLHKRGRGVFPTEIFKNAQKSTYSVLALCKIHMKLQLFRELLNNISLLFFFISNWITGLYRILQVLKCI